MDVPVIALEFLAAQINSEHASGLDNARSAVEHARRAGELLLQAKQRLRHGEWLPWLETNCPDVSARSATGYMQVARHPPEVLESQTLRKALARLSKPKSATVADLPEWDPTDPIQREMMEALDRLKTGVSLRNLPRPTFLPLESGSITYGLVEDSPRFVLFESQTQPGYWHDADLQDGTISIRPVLPIGLCVRFAQSPGGREAVWGMGDDDGRFAEFIGAE